MKANRSLIALSTVFTMACASTLPTPATVPTNASSRNPAQPTPVVPPINPALEKPRTHNGAWTFTYAPGSYTYSITTEATIAPIGDTTQKRQTPEIGQKTTITIASSGDVQVTDPLAVTSGSCDSNAALTTRAQQLIPKLPNHLTVGDHWRDSTTTTGCRGMIPAESTVISNYTTLGDTAFANTAFANTAALQIQRIDSLSANGEGAEGQHRIHVTAKGTATTNLFFDVVTGRFIGSHGLQTSLVNVTTSGRLTQFIQYVTESVMITGL